MRAELDGLVTFEEKPLIDQFMKNYNESLEATIVDFHPIWGYGAHPDYYEWFSKERDEPQEAIDATGNKLEAAKESRRKMVQDLRKVFLTR